ncbi:MAG: pseudouridine synthase [Acidiferrobacterales bacterium]|nr:pseudouridine synthase [Acidiferrobacterales bacterium]
MLVLFNKPFNVLSQFTDQSGRKTLADYIDLPRVYAAGRLDATSEGLLLLTDDGALQNKIAHPKFNKKKEYWVQVDGSISQNAIDQLKQGICLKDGPTKPAQVRLIKEPDLWPRDPPVRYRANIPTSWIHMIISEGRNRQIRRMTAAVGFPTLRLIRTQIGEWSLGDLMPGAYDIVE